MNAERSRPEARKTHECAIRHREHIDITGVREVTSFDDGAVLLVTDCGDLTLEGDGLHVGTLDTDKGIISVDGKINALYYTDSIKKGRRGFFSRDKD